MDIRNIFNGFSDVGSTYLSTTDERLKKNCTIIDSMMNEYVPVNTIVHADYRAVGAFKFFIGYVNMSRNKLTHWSVTNSLTTSNKLSHFRMFLENFFNPLFFLKGGHTYRVSKHFITKVEGLNGIYPIQYMLVVKTSEVYNIRLREFNPDIVKIIVRRSFAENPEDRLMYNIVKREVIAPLLELGVDIIYTNTPEKWAFNLPVTKINFAGLSEMREYTNQINKRVLDEYFK